MILPAKQPRRGTILPLLAICTVSITAFTALAIDLGTIMVARNQCQNAADVAAMAGARLLNGDPTSNYNSSNATAGAMAAAEANQILSQPIQAAQVTIQLGSYTYNPTAQTFQINIPKASNDGYNLVQATVTFSAPTFFAQVFGITNLAVNATATAAHHPRDVVIVMDLTGSMKFGSLLGYPWYGNRTSSNNPDPLFPIFGHYAAATLQGTTTNYDSNGNVFPPSNWTDTDSYNNNAPAIVANDFFQSIGPPAVPAFTAASSSYAGSPAGNNFPHVNFDNGSAWARNVQDFVGSSNVNDRFQGGGYDTYKLGGQPFAGYTQGPGYWGKTFFMWPPDPRSTWDWRQKFFIDAVAGGGVILNSRLFSSTGSWLAPGSNTYKINYQAILTWITQSPNPFPSQMVAGRIQYYSAIPDGTDSTLNSRFWTQFPLSNLSERFWKQYIDYALGLQQTGSSSWRIITQRTGYGSDFRWGAAEINTSFDPATDSQGRYMDYTDNPTRPLLRMWFGPMTLIDFISNYNLDDGVHFDWMAGTAHEVPLYPCKLAMQAALQDIQNNHPNDLVAMVMFATPKTSPTDTFGRFNSVRNPLGRNYSRMIQTLWFPTSTIDSTGTTNPFNTEDMLNTPHAQGGTSYAMGLMLAYNQLSCNTSLQTYDQTPPAPLGNAGGLGRKGARKVIIFETDGEPNTTAAAAFANQGPYNSYYQVRYNSSNPGASDFPTGVNGYPDNSSVVTSQIYNVAGQIVALDSASPPGYSTASNPALIHCIGFGPVFDTGSSQRGVALATLQQMQYIGNTQPSPSTPLPSYKVIVGTPAAMVAALRTAIMTILNDGVQITLLN